MRAEWVPGPTFTSWRAAWTNIHFNKVTAKLCGLLPRNVRRFAWYCGGAVLIGDVGIPPLCVGEWTASHVATQLGTTVVAAAVFAGLFYPLFRLATRHRSNAARWTLLLAALLPAPFEFSNWPESCDPPGIVAVIILSNVIAAAGFVFLFTGDARPWFARSGSA
jgi:hypothetical protein